MSVMQHNDDSHEIVRPGEARGQWLAMQAAYAEYKRTSGLLNSEDPSSGDLSGWRDLEAQQRAAFEKYLEARMDYLETRFDETSTRGEHSVDPSTRERTESTIGSRFARYRLLVLALALGLVCMVVFSVMRTQKRMHELEASRDDLRAALTTARDDIQRVANRVDARPPAPEPATPELKPQPAPKPQSASPVRRSYRFSLVPSRRFKRVGPIEVSLRSVDARQNRISLSIQSQSSRFNLQHVRLNQPVRINGGDPGQRIELVIDRIAADGIYGRLIEYRA